MKNFIFDLYGTLVDIKTDEHSLKFWQQIKELLQGYTSCAIDEDVEKIYLSLCHAKCEQIDDGGEFDLIEVFEDLLHHLGVDESVCKKDEFATKFRELSTKKLRLFPYIKEMLSMLKEKGNRVYLLSNAQACFTNGELEDLEIANLFDGIIISSNVGVKKPCKRVFDIALDTFNISKEDTYFVGNDLHDDIYGAGSVGLKTIYIKTKQSSNNNPKGKPTINIGYMRFAKLKRTLLNL